MSEPAVVTDQDTTVRVSPAVKAEIERRQQEFRRRFGGRISASEVIGLALFDRPLAEPEPVQP